MAKNKVEIDVKVDDKGTTKKVGVGAKNAADNLDKAGKSAHNTDRQLKGAAQASSNTTKNFSKMSQGISGGLVPAYATLAAQLFAVSAAFNFLKRAGDIVTLQRGQEAFAATTGTAMRALAKDIIAATDAQIGFQEASQAAAIGIASGLSPEQLTRLGTAAKQTAAILGRDVTDAFNRLVRGTTKAEPELLDELGIILRLDKATGDYADKIGKHKNELSAFERTQAVTNDVLAQAEEKFGKIEAAVGLTVNPFNQLGKAFDDIIIQIQEFTAAVAGPLAKVLTDFPVLVGGAFAFFSKGILTAAIPGVAAFGDNLNKVAQDGVKNLGALQAQSLAANRALAAGLADPEAAAAMGAAARSQLQGSMGAVGITGGVFKIAEGDGPIGNAALGKMRSQLQKMYGDASDIADEALDGMIANIDDLVLQNDVGMGKVVSSQTAMQKSGSLKFAKLKTDAKLAFASIGQKGAAAFSMLGRAMNMLGIAAMAVSFGLMAFNFIKSKMAGDKLTSTLDIQARKMELLKDKVKSLSQEFANFNIIQGVLGRDRGTAAAGAVGNRLSALSESDIRLGLRAETPGSSEIKDFNKGRNRFLAAQRDLDPNERDFGLVKKELDRLNKAGALNPEDIMHGEFRRVQAEYKELLTKVQEGRAERDADASYGRGLIASMGDDPKSVTAQLVDEQKGITDAMRNASKHVAAYDKELNELLASETALNTSQIESIASKRALAAADLVRIGQVQRLNTEADKQLTSINKTLFAQSKYATSIASVNSAIEASTKAGKVLNDQEREKLELYERMLPILKELEEVEKRRALEDATRKVTGAEMQQRGRGSRGGQNLFASGRKESARLFNLDQAELQRTRMQENIATLQGQIRSGSLGAQQIKDAKHQIKLKRQSIELQDIAIQKLKDEGNQMLQFGLQVSDTLEGSLSNAFLAMIDGSKSASEAMKDFAKNVLASMAQIAANQLAAQILTGIGGFFTGPAGGATIQMSQPTMVARRGGLFENAPGYRNGKMPGMYSEGGIAKGRQAGYPAILHGTEAVVPLPNGNKIPVEMKGGGGDQNNIVINVSSEGNTSAGGTGSSVSQQKEVGKALAAAVQKELIKQKRPGGLLSPYGAR